MQRIVLGLCLLPLACAFEGEYCDEGSGVICRPLAERCPAGRYWSGETCLACCPGVECVASVQTLCEPGTSWDDDGDPATSCVAATPPCAPGSVQSLAATSLQDRRCEDCSPGEFCAGYTAAKVDCVVGEDFDDDGDPATPCEAVSECGHGSYQKAAPGLLHDRQCDACAPGNFCPGGDVEPEPCTLGETWDHDGDPGTACVAVRALCPLGSNQIAPASLTEDRICEPCAAGEFCPGGEEPKRPCILGSTWDHDDSPETECGPVSLPCSPGHVQTVAPTPTSDRLCIPCEPGSYCRGGEHSEVLCTPGVTWDHDEDPKTTCRPIDPACSPGWREVAAPAPGSEGQCRACDPGFFCTGAGPGEPCEVGASFDHDLDPSTECIPPRTCGDGLRELAPPTATADRSCERLPLCVDGGGFGQACVHCDEAGSEQHPSCNTCEDCGGGEWWCDANSGECLPHDRWYCEADGSCTIVMFIDDDADTDGDGASWQTAYRSLHDVPAQVGFPHEIWMAAGTYRPDGGGSFETGATDSCFSPPTARVFGGFAGDEYDRDLRDWSLNQTVLSGDLAGDDDDDPATWEENSQRLLCGSGWHLDGVSIRSVQATGAHQHEHPALSLFGDFRNVEVARIHSWNLFAAQMTGNFENVEFHHITGTGGGALIETLGDVVVRGGRFHRNRSDVVALMGSMNNGDTLVLEDVVFEHNEINPVILSSRETNIHLRDVSFISNGWDVGSGQLIKLRNVKDVSIDNLFAAHNRSLDFGDVEVQESLHVRGLDIESMPGNVEFAVRPSGSGTLSGIRITNGSGNSTLELRGPLFVHDVTLIDNAIGRRGLLAGGHGVVLSGLVAYAEEADRDARLFEIAGDFHLLSSTIVIGAREHADVYCNHGEASLRIDNSIIAGGVLRRQCAPEVIVARHSLVSGGLGGGSEAIPIFDGDPDVPAFTLAGDSPGVDSGDLALLPVDRTDADGDGDFGEWIPFDANGQPRVRDGGLDIGAVERQVGCIVPRSWDHDGDAGTACEPTTPCAEGFREVTAPTSTSDRICEPIPP